MPPSERPDPSLEKARIFLRPIANPFALGLVGLAGASIAVSAAELGYAKGGDRHQAALIVLVFAPLLQTIASVFGFLARDAAAATGMGTLAGVWAAVGLVLLTTPPGSTSTSLGIFLFVAGAAVLVSSAGATLTKLVPAVVLVAAAIRFFLTAVSQVSGSDAWQDASGYAGLVVAFLALYAAAALELEDVRKRPLLPTFRVGKGRAALAGGLPAQVGEVDAEAGVRKAL